MSDILIKHYSIKHFAILNSTSWQLLNFCVSLDINFKTRANFSNNSLDGLDGKVDDEVAPFEGKLSANARANYLSDVFFFFNVDWNAQLFGNLHDIIKCFEVSLDDLGRMDILLNEWLCRA